MPKMLKDPFCPQKTPVYPHRCMHLKVSLTWNKNSSMTFLHVIWCHFSRMRYEHLSHVSLDPSQCLYYTIYFSVQRMIWKGGASFPPECSVFCSFILTLEESTLNSVIFDQMKLHQWKRSPLTFKGSSECQYL